jgi:hypothetical protein
VFGSQALRCRYGLVEGFASVAVQSGGNSYQEDGERRGGACEAVRGTREFEHVVAVNR